MRTFVHITAACLLVVSLGAHWALLQTVAWTGMVISYSQSTTLQQAISKTFDGKHPCPLCKAIQEGRADEQKREAQNVNSTPKLDVAIVWQPSVFVFGAEGERVPTLKRRAPARQEQPPKPRPRLA